MMVWAGWGMLMIFWGCLDLCSYNLGWGSFSLGCCGWGGMGARIITTTVATANRVAVGFVWIVNVFMWIPNLNPNADVNAIAIAIVTWSH